MLSIVQANIYLVLIGLSFSQPLEYFYNANTQTCESVLENGCLKRSWSGKDPEGLTGHPWVSHINCEEDSTFSLYGVNIGGPIQIWIERGSMDVNGKVLDVIGSSIWINVGSTVSLDIKEGGSVWVVGALLDVRDVEPARFVNYGDTEGQTPPAYRHYHSLDFLEGLADNVHDSHINNGTANAHNLIWNTRTRVDPSTILVVNCEAQSWVDYHIHTGGALYLSFSGAICFKTDQIRCIKSGEARWTSPNLFYYESFENEAEPNLDSLMLSAAMDMDCVSPSIFAVTNFDPSSNMGVPIFTEQPCVMPDGIENRWGYCEQMATWTTRYTPRIVTISPDEN